MIFFVAQIFAIIGTTEQNFNPYNRIFIILFLVMIIVRFLAVIPYNKKYPNDPILDIMYTFRNVSIYDTISTVGFFILLTAEVFLMLYSAKIILISIIIVYLLFLLIISFLQVRRWDN